MSDSTIEPVPPIAPPTSVTDSPPPTPQPAKNKLALAALIVGIVAMVCAIIPGLSFIAFVPAVTALGLGIAGLVSKAPGRGKALVGVILGPVALLVAIIVSIGFIANNALPTVDDAGPVPIVDAPEGQVTEEPIDVPDEEGTRDNPAPFGSVIEISDASGPIWSVQIGAANLNAGAVVAAENQFNPAPDAGTQYVLVPVTYTYLGNESGTPWFDVTVEYVSATGVTYTEAFAVIPNPANEINELYNGASATGNILLVVPSVDIAKGAWTIGTFLSDPYFVKIV